MEYPSVEPVSLRLSLAVYRGMLRVYPASFRRDYGAWMLQAFRDCWLDAARQNRAGALAALWGRTILDYFLSVVEQYANRGVEMSRSLWIKGSGWALVVSGLLWVLSWLASSRPEFSPYNAASWPIDRYLNMVVMPLQVMGVILVTAGILGIRARFSHQVSGLGRGGLLLGLLCAVISLAGGIGLWLFESGPWWEMTMLGMTGVFLGLFLFGLDCMRLKLFTRWNALPLLLAIPWPALVLISLFVELVIRVPMALSDGVFAVVIAFAFGGLVLTGYRLQADTPRGWSPLG